MARALLARAERRAVRGDDDPRMRPGRSAGRQRLGVEHVDHRAADLPRPASTSPALRGNRASVSARRMPAVAAVSGNRLTRMSLAARNAGNSASPAKQCMPGSVLRVIDQPASRKPRPANAAGVSAAMRPNPISPTRTWRAVRGGENSSHAPARWLARLRGRSRSSARQARRQRRVAGDVADPSPVAAHQPQVRHRREPPGIGLPDEGVGDLRRIDHEVVPPTHVQVRGKAREPVPPLGHRRLAAGLDQQQRSDISLSQAVRAKLPALPAAG